MRWLLILLLVCLPIQSEAAVLWFAGAESGDLRECTQTSSGNAGAFNSGQKTGGYAYGFAENTTNGGFCIGRKGLSTSTLFARLQFKYTVQLPGTTQTVARFLNAAQTDGIEVCMDTSGHLCWRLLSGAVVTTGSTVLALNTYYKIDFKAVVDASTGGVELKINDVVEFTSLGTNTSAVANLDQLQFGPARNSALGTSFFNDDVMVCDTTYCPSGGTIARQGTAGTPTDDAWTKNGCSGGTIDNCWSNTPFDASSNATSSTAGAAQTMLTASFFATQTGHGTEVMSQSSAVNACKTAAIAKQATAPSLSLRRRLNGSNTDTVISPGTTDGFFDDGIWTSSPTFLSSSEMGGVHGAGTDAAQIEDMWMMCDAVNATLVKHRVYQQ